MKESSFFLDNNAVFGFNTLGTNGLIWNKYE